MAERAVHDRGLGVVLFAAVWTVIAVVAATTSYIALGGSSVTEWLWIFGHMLSYFYAWAVVSIGINWLVNRNRGTNPRLARQLLEHLALLVVVSVALPFILHPGNWESWLTGERAIGFHALNAFIYSFVLIGSMMVNYYRLSRASEASAHAAALQQVELERSLEKSRMEALRAQINPHFLFNALNSIAALVEASSNEEAYALIERVAELLRNALDFSRDTLVTLARELQFLDTYLAIEKIRYADRFNVIKRVPRECLGFDVPSFSLQPLVENVIKHVLSKTSDPVNVLVEASCTDRKLVLQVRDNGPGLQSSVHFGVGLCNISKRLQYLFGNDASVDVRNGKTGGVLVKLTMPAQTSVARGRGAAGKENGRDKNIHLAGSRTPV